MAGTEHLRPAVNFECKDCAERSMGCHSVCEKYLSLKKKNDEILQKKSIETDNEERFVEHVIKTKKMSRKYKKGRL